jgi:phosphatidate cytidylyltransferase
VTGAQTAAPNPGPSNLALRWISSLVLAPIVIVISYVGGWPFVAFWTLAACIVLWEWSTLVRAGSCSTSAFVGWMMAGLAYAGVLVLAPAILRSDAALGFVAIIFLFAVVWGTDVFAYFAGRAFGGPKLMPAVSPKKTWSGAAGGTLGAVAAGLFVVRVAGRNSRRRSRPSRCCSRLSRRSAISLNPRSNAASTPRIRVNCCLVMGD